MVRNFLWWNSSTLAMSHASTLSVTAWVIHGVTPWPVIQSTKSIHEMNPPSFSSSSLPWFHLPSLGQSRPNQVWSNSAWCIHVHCLYLPLPLASWLFWHYTAMESIYLFWILFPAIFLIPVQQHVLWTFHFIAGHAMSHQRMLVLKMDDMNCVKISMVKWVIPMQNNFFFPPVEIRLLERTQIY